MPNKHGDPQHRVIEKDIHDLREDVQSMKTRYSSKEIFNNEFRAVVQEETKDIKIRTQKIAIHFANIDGQFKLIKWLLGICSAGIITLIVFIIVGLIK